MQSEIILDKFGVEVKVQVRLSQKAKNINIRINGINVELVLPNKNLQSKIWLNKKIQDGYKFLLTKELWIRSKLKQKENNLAQYNIEKDNLFIFGEPYKLIYIDSQHRNIQILGNEIKVFSHSCLHKLTLTKFLKNKLLVKINNEINQLIPHFNKKITNIIITNNKTKWGSCSSQGILRFNWRLVFAPENIINYVIIHEMCHLIEMNHSKNFWHLVQKFYPEFKNAILWLKENGSRLYQYLN